MLASGNVMSANAIDLTVSIDMADGAMATVSVAVQSDAPFSGTVEVETYRAGVSGTTTARQVTELALQDLSPVIVATFSTNLPPDHFIEVTAIARDDEGTILKTVTAAHGVDARHE